MRSASHRVIDWLKDFARERKLEIKGDAYGNQVIYRPGTGGGESAPTVVVQVQRDLPRLAPAPACTNRPHHPLPALAGCRPFGLGHFPVLPVLT